MSLMIEGWMPSVGSSSSSSFGRITSARPMASCCCWPPDRSPPRRPSMLASTGNSANTSSGTVRSSRLSGAKPVSRFSSTVSSGKISRPCGTIGDAGAGALHGGEPVISVPPSVMEPLLTGCWPTMARSRLVLPTPLRPSTQVTLPGSAFSEMPRNACAAP